MKRVAVVTVGRSDYNIYRPIMAALSSAAEMESFLFVSGSHLSEAHGMTIREIEKDGFPIAARIDIEISDDSAAAISRSMALAVEGFGKAIARERPDIMLVLGDRFEMLSAAASAIPHSLPVAHIHGGETTEGANDDLMRHAITKMSHLHFVAIEEYGRRVVQMGEEPWRVTVTGAPALDNLEGFVPLSREELSAKLGLALDSPPLLVSLHPVTLRPDEHSEALRSLLSSLERESRPIVVSAPNNDLGGEEIARELRKFCEARSNAIYLPSAGPLFYSLLASAAAMIGNSSSGIIEAPSFGLPVVNIGSRQKGRIRAGNVIDCSPSREEIEKALGRALDPSFKSALGRENPYGEGSASRRILEVLSAAPSRERLLTKAFHSVS